MKIQRALFGATDAIDRAGALKEAGATGVFTFEGPNDVLAHQANDHQLLSEGADD